MWVMGEMRPKRISSCGIHASIAVALVVTVAANGFATTHAGGALALNFCTCRSN